MRSFRYGLILHQRSLKKHSQYSRLLCFFSYWGNYPLAVAGTCSLDFCQHRVTVLLNDSMTVSAYLKDGAAKKDVPLWRHTVLCSLVTPTDINNVSFALISDKLCYILLEIQFPCKIWGWALHDTFNTKCLFGCAISGFCSTLQAQYEKRGVQNGHPLALQHYQNHTDFCDKWKQWSLSPVVTLRDRSFCCVCTC